MRSYCNSHSRSNQSASIATCLVVPLAPAAALAVWDPVRKRITASAPPEYVYRPKLAVWEETHTLPAMERSILETFRGN